MKTGLLGITSVLWLGLLAAACSGQPVKQGPEVLYPGEFVESVDANNIDIVKCRGKGVDQDAAIENARKGCLEWMITERMAQSPGERRAYMAQQDQIMAKLDRYIPPLKPGSRAGTGEGVKSRTRNNDGTVNVEINIKVYSKNLRKDLVAMNIIQSKDETLARVGKPYIMVQPAPASRGNKNRGLIETLLESYLAEQRWKVKNAKGVQDFEKMLDALSEAYGRDEDEVDMIAKAVGANIFVTFEVDKDTAEGMAGDQVSYSIGLKAYETVSNDLLGARMVTGVNYYDNTANAAKKALQSPLQDGMAQLMRQIMEHWKEDGPKGQRFSIALMNPPKDAGLELKVALKKQPCSDTRLERSTGKTALLIAQCKLDNAELFMAVRDIIKEKLGSSPSERLINQNSVVIYY